MSVFPIPDFLGDFWQRKVCLLGLQDKVFCCDEVLREECFDTIIFCFDGVKDLLSLSRQLCDFYKMLSRKGKFILNWYFFKEFNQKFAFYDDALEIVEVFFLVFQKKLFKGFSLYFITGCCYGKWG